MTASLLTEIIFYPVCKKRSVSQDAAAFLSFFILFRTLYTFIPRMAFRFLPNALRRPILVIPNLIKTNLSCQTILATSSTPVCRVFPSLPIASKQNARSGHLRHFIEPSLSRQAIFALIFPRTLALASFAPSVSANPPSLRHAARVSETFSYSAAHPPTTDASSG